MRLFAAIPIERTLREWIDRAIGEYRGAFPGARWIRSENLHLTLRFFGEVPDAAIGELVDFLESGVSGMEEEVRPLVVSGFGRFEGNARDVFWIGVRNDRWLTELAARLSGPVANVVPEDRPFRPHVTVCRIRLDREGRETTHEMQNRLARRGIAEGTQSELRCVLYESDLSQPGSSYREIWTRRLI